MGKARYDAKGRQNKMQKTIIFRAYNGTEIVDTRPEAEIAYSNMKYAEECYTREQKFAEKLHKNKHPFAKKLMAACGLL